MEIRRYPYGFPIDVLLFLYGFHIVVIGFRMLFVYFSHGNPRVPPMDFLLISLCFCMVFI